MVEVRICSSLEVSTPTVSSSSSRLLHEVPSLFSPQVYVRSMIPLFGMSDVLGGVGTLVFLHGDSPLEYHHVPRPRSDQSNELLVVH